MKSIDFKDSRLARIAGQARGIDIMASQNRKLLAILTQTSAMRAAIASFERKLICDHLKSGKVKDVLKALDK